jgi:hypothetical protein
MRFAIGLVLSVLMTTPVLAAHNNPWATAEDTVLGKNHDANQEQSVGTPGEDEMRGEGAQDPDRGSGRGGQSRGGGGQGRDGGGGNGHGGGGNGHGGGGNGHGGGRGN